VDDTGKAKRAAYLRKILKTEQQDKTMHTLYALMHTKGSKAFQNTNRECLLMSFNMPAKTMYMSMHMDKASVVLLRSYIQDPAKSANLRELLCGPQQVGSQGLMFDFFARLFWTSAADEHMCNTMIVSTVDPDLHALPDGALILAKIAHLEWNVHQYVDKDLRPYDLAQKHKTEDEILKWQILSIMADVVTNYKQAAVRAEVEAALRAKQALQVVPERYQMNRYFRTMLRSIRKTLDSAGFEIVPVTMRLMLAFLHVILTMQDQRLMEVFQHFADEYVRTGGSIHKKFSDYVNAEMNGYY